MNALTVEVELPGDLLGALGVPKGRLKGHLKELIALELFREGRISSGKGAELLGIGKTDFIQILARHGVSYFTETPEGLAEQVSAAEALAGK